MNLDSNDECGDQTAGEQSSLRYAIPTNPDDGQVSTHFGHARIFTMIDVDLDSGEIIGGRGLEPPEHEPGVLPRWLEEQGADVVLTGGIGQRARQILEDCGIAVVTGVVGGRPEDLVAAHLDGTLEVTDNACTH